MRDYVHVNDLTSAHLQAVHFLENRGGAHCFNLGSGRGVAVMEIIAASREVTGCEIAFKRKPRRSGDPPTLVADTRRAETELFWQPAFADTRAIIETEWRWPCSPHY
ncbi:hypothetical protein ACFFJT_12760 [Dyella flava]|uniref:hypothetical protein n=1 Tax=Dyella flava TaxID=1920170 RepID=UPI001EF941E5|nr:hypothetical protein [Dyella flava]